MYWSLGICLEIISSSRQDRAAGQRPLFPVKLPPVSTTLPFKNRISSLSVPRDFFYTTFIIATIPGIFCRLHFSTGIPVNKAASLYTAILYLKNHNSFINFFIQLQKPDSLKRLLVNLGLAENTVQYITVI